MIEVVSPFPEFAVPRVWDWIETFREKVCDDYSPTTREAFVEQTLAQLRSGVRSWAIYRDGDLGGMVTYQAWNPRVGTMHTLFKRAFWGRSTTETALRTIGNDVFSSGVEKVTAYFFEDNHALRGLLRHFGAKREGWFEAQTIRGGKPVAMEAVAIFRERFYASSNCSSADIGGNRSGGVDLLSEVGEEDGIGAELHPGTAGGTEPAQSEYPARSREPGESGPPESRGDRSDQH
jgi:RimJ/RimL family protein N-acetyltransferase